MRVRNVDVSGLICSIDVQYSFSCLQFYSQAAIAVAHCSVMHP